MVKGPYTAISGSAEPRLDARFLLMCIYHDPTELRRTGSDIESGARQAACGLGHGRAHNRGPVLGGVCALPDTAARKKDALAQHLFGRPSGLERKDAPNVGGDDDATSALPPFQTKSNPWSSDVVA